MPTIELITHINAPIQLVFDLSRDLDLHRQSMEHSKEKAIAGRLSGLIEEGETVTWEAKHFFKIRHLTSKIVSMKAPFYFRDEMIEGDFLFLHHDHFFAHLNGITEMKDVFAYKAPYGILGRLIEFFFLTRYLKQLLISRNLMLKAHAENFA